MKLLFLAIFCIWIVNSGCNKAFRFNGLTQAQPTAVTPENLFNNGPPNEEALVEYLSNTNPSLIHDCIGKPLVNDFLFTVVRALQLKDPRWGFFLKSGPTRIPRDILAYAWSNQRDGTQNIFIIDFVASGCSNMPTDSDFNNPAPNAKVYWNVLNADTGFAGNGVWAKNPS